MTSKRRRAEKLERLSIRNAVATPHVAAPAGADHEQFNRELTYRALPVKAASFDETTRSVDAVLSTNQPVQVIDWMRYEMIDEILVSTGARFAEQLPLLDSHARYSIGDQLGSIRGIRATDSTVNGRLHFAANVQRAEEAMQMVKQGHTTDVSVGYRATKFTEIAAGQSGIVDGKTYTASAERGLRVTTEWQIREASLTPIGADPAAKIREVPQATPATHTHPPAPVARATSPDGVPSMNPAVRKYLESLGLRAAPPATDAEAQTFLAGITPAQREYVDAIPPQAPATAAAPPDAARSAATTIPTPATVASTDAIRAEAAAAERTRISEINRLAGLAGVPDTVRAAAIADATVTPAIASQRFLEQHIATRTAPVGIIVPGMDAIRSPEVLEAGLMLRMGREDMVIRRNSSGDQRAAQTRLAEQGNRFRDYTLRDILRACLAIEGRQIPHDTHEMIRAATMTGAATVLFSTSANKMIMAGFEGLPDTTQGWCSEHSLPNFKTHDSFGLQKQGSFDRLGRGGTANQATYNEVAESYKPYRYAKQAAIDEQDIIDDDLSALQTILPEMGEACARIRPDLVYSIIHANAALNADSVALFHSSHGGNTTTGALAVATLQASMAIMLKQTENGAQLNLPPMFLIVPHDLVFTAKQLVSSALLISDTTQGNRNVIADYNMQVVSESRMGVAGVTNPVTGTSYAGLATNYLLASKPGRTIQVGYVNGQKTPRVRTFVLDKGQYGMGFDVNLDIGAKALGYQGLVFSTGA